MSLTLDEVMERLGQRYDPDYLVELLDISSEELLEAFVGKVSANYEELCDELEEDQ